MEFNNVKIMMVRWLLNEILSISETQFFSSKFEILTPGPIILRLSKWSINQPQIQINTLRETGKGELWDYLSTLSLDRVSAIDGRGGMVGAGAVVDLAMHPGS